MDVKVIVKPIPERPSKTSNTDWFGHVVGIGKLVTAIVVVFFGAYLVHRQTVAERHDIAITEGHAVATAYAVQLGQVARGVEDMVVCKEKLLQFATGEGT